VVEGRYLTYLTSSADLLAAPVDLKTGRVGRAVRMAAGVGLADFTGNGSYAISASGTLVYAQRDNKTMGHLVHLTDRGIDTLSVGRERFISFRAQPRRSPSGRGGSIARRYGVEDLRSFLRSIPDLGPGEPPW
jgi:hypothetical protein